MWTFTLQLTVLYLPIDHPTAHEVSSCSCSYECCGTDVYCLSAWASTRRLGGENVDLSPCPVTGTFRHPIRNIKASCDIDAREFCWGYLECSVELTAGCCVRGRSLQSCGQHTLRRKPLALSLAGLFAVKFSARALVRWACPLSSPLRHPPQVIGRLIAFLPSSIPFGSSAWTVSGE